MSSSVAGPGGSSLYVESAGGIFMPVSKIHTGANDVDGGAVTAANPFFIQQSDGSAAIVGAKTGQLPTTVGQLSAALSLSTTAAKSLGTQFASIPTAGISLKGSAGSGYIFQFYNSTGSTIFCMVFDASSTRSNGSAFLYSSAQVLTAALSSFTLGSNIGGLPFSVDLWVQFSSTAASLTAIASTAVTATYLGI